MKKKGHIFFYAPKKIMAFSIPLFTKFIIFEGHCTEIFFCQISSNFVEKYRNCGYRFIQVHTVKFDSHCSDFHENRASSTAVPKVQFSSDNWRLRRYIQVFHLDTVFSWFSYVHEQMLRWYPRCQVATTCFSCSPPRP